MNRPASQVSLRRGSSNYADSNYNSPARSLDRDSVHNQSISQFDQSVTQPLDI